MQQQNWDTWRKEMSCLSGKRNSVSQLGLGNITYQILCTCMIHHRRKHTNYFLAQRTNCSPSQYLTIYNKCYSSCFNICNRSSSKSASIQWALICQSIYNSELSFTIFFIIMEEIKITSWSFPSTKHTTCMPR